MTDFIRAALWYAELHYAVFPCAPGRKTPLTEHGFRDATTEPEHIEAWWRRTPQANVAVATAGLVVIDVDAESDQTTELVHRLRSVDAAPRAHTANAGCHYIFRQPPGKTWRCTTGRLARCIDTRAAGGYIVVPPSRLAGGGEYRWADGLALEAPPDGLPEPPDWLTEELDRLGDAWPAKDPPLVAQGQANPIPKGHRNATLARIAGGMRRMGMSQAEIGSALEVVNRDRCEPPLVNSEVGRIAASVARYAPDEVSVALVENHWQQMCEEQPADQQPHADPGPVPTRLLRMPGFVGAVMEHTMATAPYPEPVLAFGGAIALQAVLAGRKVRDTVDNRTNLYVLGLANSGAGKDHPRKVNQRILYEVGMTDCLGDSFASGEGIEDRMGQHPAVLFQTDEMDGLMLKIRQSRDGRHEGIVSTLLKMNTSSNAVYVMRVKADRDLQFIDQPCLCIFGTAIPKHFYEALSLKMLTNGFLARMLILEAGKRRAGQEPVPRDLPAAILNVARWWAEFNPGGNQGNLEHFHPDPAVVEQTSGAAEVLRDFRLVADQEWADADGREDTGGTAIWARAAEKARRLALIYACSKDHETPVITAEAAEWACEFVNHQTRRMLFMAADYVSENEFDARCKAVIESLRRWRDKRGDEWMPFWQLSRRHPWSEREHEEVRTALLNQRLIQYEERKTGGTPQRLYRLA